MHEVFTAPITLALKLPHVSEPPATESTSEPTTPSTAASVGVAMPA